MEEVVPNQKPSQRRWLLVAVVAAILVALFLFGWIPRLSNRKEINALAVKKSVAGVPTLRVEPNTKPNALILPSSAQAWHITPIWARVNGYLIRYLVDIGDSVKKGDLLAEIDTPETDEQVAQAKADLANSIAERDIAKITADRWQTLWDKNKEAVSKQEVDQYQGNLEAAQATVVANEKNVARLVAQQQFKFIYAPFDGTVTQRSIDIGSLIYGNVNGTPQELFQMAQTHLMRFFVEVPQNYFRQIKEGLEAEITIQTMPDKVFKGNVTRFAKALDPTARTLLTEVDVENPDGILYPGLFGRVKFIMQPDTLNFIVPTTAIIIRSGYPHVAVVDSENKVHMQEVKIGRDYGKEMEIISGLKADDLIITIPNDEVFEGATVNLLPNKDSTEKVLRPPSA